jgi:enoyl-CoA hydratase/carnithine racemase
MEGGVMMSVSNNHLEYRAADGVATITLNRPEQLNAVTRAMCVDFAGLLDRADADDGVRAVIVTGAGRAFCAGADLNATDSLISTEGRTAGDPRNAAIRADGSVDWSDPSMRDLGGLMTLRLFDCLKPVIIAFNGAAAGVGVTLALAADFRLAASTAKFSLPFVRRGIVPESASSWFLPRIVGISKALDWTLTGRVFPASEALASGLVQSLHAPEDLMEAALGIAGTIAEHTAPVSVALARQMLWKSLGVDHPMEAHKIESRGVFARARTGDLVEGIASFKEKRLPKFQNRVSADMPEFYPWWPPRAYE